MFNSIISTTGVKPHEILIILLVSLAVGFLFSFINYIKSKFSKGFFITASLIPMTVAMVIIFVNGQIGTGIAVAGAFSLIRFRTIPGTAKEIVIIFISMAMGLGFGMGYLAYAIMFGLISSLAIFILNISHVFDGKTDSNSVIIKIMIPEDLDYPNIFNDIFDKYTKSVELLKVKSKNMGSMFLLTYKISLLDLSKEKSFIDEIRTRNGNLEISISRLENFKEEL